MIHKLLLALTALSIGLVSCSGGMYNRGQRELDGGNYPDAVSHLQDALKRKPESGQLWRDLGIAYYRQGQYNDAINALKQSQALSPQDGAAVLYLGLANERLGDNLEASKIYSSYLQQFPKSKLGQKIGYRAKYLSDQVVQARIKDAISAEKSIKTEQIPDNTVAVLGFNPGNLPPRQAPLARGLTQLVMIDLSKVSGLTVVERVMLKAVLDELQLAQADYFDKTKAPRAGRLLGAAKVVSGDLSGTSENEFKAESGIIGVKDGFVEYPDPVNGKLDQFFALEKQLTRNIISSMGYKLSPDEEARLRELPTTSFEAFLSYSLGLQYEDQGMYDLARAQFENAIAEDPGFKLAGEALGQVKNLSGYTGEVEPAPQLDQDIASAMQAEAPAVSPVAGFQVLQTALGFQTVTGTDPADNPYTTPVVGTGQVTIIGIFDEP